MLTVWWIVKEKRKPLSVSIIWELFVVPTHLVQSKDTVFMQDGEAIEKRRGVFCRGRKRENGRWIVGKSVSHPSLIDYDERQHFCLCCVNVVEGVGELFWYFNELEKGVEISERMDVWKVIYIM